MSVTQFTQITHVQAIAVQELGPGRRDPIRPTRPIPEPTTIWYQGTVNNAKSNTRRLPVGAVPILPNELSLDHQRISPDARAE